MTVTKSKSRIADNGKAESSSLYAPDRLVIQVVGVTPLLCANPAGMQPETDSSGRASSKKAKSNAEVCRSAAYFDSDGHCAFPNNALPSAIYGAAELMKLRVGAGKYAPSALSIITAGLYFDWNVKFVKLLNLKTMEPLTEADYEIDMQRAVNQNTGGGIVAIRPRFDAWAARFHLLVDSQNPDLMGILDDKFVEILRFAGMTIGIGAFRGMIRKRSKAKIVWQPGGPYGKFSATVVDQV